MPRLTSTRSLTGAAAYIANRNGQLKVRCSFNYELDLPGNNAAVSTAGALLRPRTTVDDLGALVDKALAFAG